MSEIAKTIGAALGGLVVEAINTIADHLRTRRVNAAAARRTMPWDRGHNWQRHLGTTPTCVWCKRELTDSNEYSPCPGP